jgi:hypothetical protein
MRLHFSFSGRVSSRSQTFGSTVAPVSTALEARAATVREPSNLLDSMRTFTKDWCAPEHNSTPPRMTDLERAVMELP